MSSMMIKTRAASRAAIQARRKGELITIEKGTEFDLLLISNPTHCSVEARHDDKTVYGCHVAESDCNRFDVDDFEIEQSILSQITDAGLSLASTKHLPGQIFDNIEPSEPFETLTSAQPDSTPILTPLELQGREQ